MTAARLRDRWRDAIRAVNRAPGEWWAERAWHHGTRLAVLLAFSISLPFVFPRLPAPKTTVPEEGVVATEDVIAAVDFVVPKSGERLAAERLAAESGVPRIMTLDPGAVDRSRGQVREFFDRVDAAFPPDGEVDSLLVRGLVAEFGFADDGPRLGYLADPQRRTALRSAVQEAQSRYLPQGVANGSDLTGPGRFVVQIRDGDSDRFVRGESIMTLGRFYQEATALAPGDATSEGLQLFQNLLIRYTEPSLRLDAEATLVARATARAQVDSTAARILEGERILSAHERVTAEDVVRVRAYNAALVRQGLIGDSAASLIPSLGAILYGFILFTLFSLVLLYFRPPIYRSIVAYVIVFGLAYLVVLAAAGLDRAGLSLALIPIAFAALCIGALYDGLIAIIAVLFTAGILAGLLPVAGVTAPFLMVAGGVVAALGVKQLRRRAQSWVLIVGITLAYLAAGMAIVAVQDELSVRTLFSTFAWGGVNATLCTALALGAAIPLLEKLTGISTDQTLVELCDLNAPLLGDLSMKAPGTYAHSINIANMAEAASLAIGANALLVRAGAYYHDIGKMLQPQYFVENQPKGRNPHDRISPARSAEIIRSHVREGLRLAGENRLPARIRDFIAEHHGTTSISYFLDKARREEADLDLNPSDFAYPGPKPQSRETAVVMLADAIESAARVLQDPTPDRISRLIDRLVGTRTEEGQLDQCPLTLRDLDLIKSQFARVLVGMYHRRVEYPGASPSLEETPMGKPPKGKDRSRDRRRDRPAKVRGGSPHEEG